MDEEEQKERELEENSKRLTEEYAQVARETANAIQEWLDGVRPEENGMYQRADGSVGIYMRVDVSGVEKAVERMRDALDHWLGKKDADWWNDQLGDVNGL